VRSTTSIDPPRNPDTNEARTDGSGMRAS
jgi:hypothetical protein